MTREEAVARYAALAETGVEAAAYGEISGNHGWGQGLWKLPSRMHGGIVRWVLFGILPGDFLRAIIRGDLFDAAGRADDENQRLLYEYAFVFYNYVPQQAKGPNALTTWKGIYPEEPVEAA